MERLIAQINELGYAVHLHQYGTSFQWCTGKEGRWDATASRQEFKPGQCHFDQIAFGATATKALETLFGKCFSAQKQKTTIDSLFEEDEEDVMS